MTMIKAFAKGRGAGFYITIAALLSGLVACVAYLLWAPAQNMLNLWVIAPLALGIALGILLLFFDVGYIAIAATGCYSVALFTLLSDSVGSFVDAFQGIVMFGDSRQIGTITAIAIWPC